MENATVIPAVESVKSTRGRKADATPNKVMTPQATRNEDGTITLHVKYNDTDGMRRSSVVRLQVTDNKLKISIL